MNIFIFCLGVPLIPWSGYRLYDNLRRIRTHQKTTGKVVSIEIVKEVYRKDHYHSKIEFVDTKGKRHLFLDSAAGTAMHRIGDYSCRCLQILTRT